MIRLLKNIILITFLLACPVANAQDGPPLLRKITSDDGLPQGFIAAIVQDSKGFIWIGTRNGLARYDGRKFRNFYHIPSIRGGLSSGIITQLWLDKKDNLWITYESGHLDIFNTDTEKVIPLTVKKGFAKLKGHQKRGRSFVDVGGTYWLLSNTGNVYVIDGALTSMRLLPIKDIVVGIASSKNSVILSTKNELIFLNHKTVVTERVAIPYKEDLYPARHEKQNALISRKNGDIAIIGSSTIRIYRPSTKKLIDIPISLGSLPHFSVPPRILDDEGTIYFEADGIGKLWPATENKIITCDLGILGSPLLIDRSGIAWTGTGGLGIEQYDLRINHLQRRSMITGFHTDILKKAGVNDRRTDKFLDTISGYYWRWVQTKEGTLWVAQSQPDAHIGSVFSMDMNKKVNYPKWKYRGGVPKKLPTCAMTEDPSGRVWGGRPRYEAVHT
ncbi:ligand-binding sensor domain-containing protein [Flavobacterium sp.]|uniref:ligand-binding sensor domain-containing protein n=1 Tax=Flavobacterium sp. TaxID=239 RepID=UPI004033DCF9